MDVMSSWDDAMGRLARRAWEGSRLHSTQARAGAHARTHTHTLMLLWIICRFTHSPRPGPPLHRWCEHVRVEARRSAAPRASVALTQHHRRRCSEGLRCHPHPAPSAHHTLHMWKRSAPPKPSPHSPNTHKPHDRPVGRAQVNKVSGTLCVLHLSAQCQNTNYNHETEWHAIMERRRCFLFLFFLLFFF